MSAAPPDGRGDDRDVVHIVAADPAWPERFGDEAAAIRSALGPLAREIAIEHVGSTAVPALSAKPVIDILLIPPDGVWPREALVAAMVSLGYVYWDANPDPDHLFFVKGMPPFGAGRTHHVHVRSRASAAAVLAFRDRLRENPRIAREYESLKCALAARFPSDREAYTRGKDEFVARVTRSLF